MLLAGFRGSEELLEAERIVSNELSKFPGSILLIYDRIDPEDPNLQDELEQRGIDRLPHLVVLKDDEPVFSYNSYNSTFSETALSSKLSDYFSFDQFVVAHEMACLECIAQYKELKQSPDATCYLSLEPIASLVWDDEHPRSLHDVVGHKRECKDWMTNLQIARNHLWEHGSIAYEHKAFWNQSITLLPNWPFFTRTVLNDSSLESFKSCVEEKKQIFEMLQTEYNAEIHYRCTGPGFVLKGYTCRPNK